MRATCNINTKAYSLLHDDRIGGDPSISDRSVLFASIPLLNITAGKKINHIS